MGIGYFSRMRSPFTTVAMSLRTVGYCTWQSGDPMSTRIVSTNGAAMSVTESGVGDPALVFLHYWGGSSRTWESVVEGKSTDRYR
jgi:hypothetical protein